MEIGREVVCDYLERNKIPKLENLKLDLSGAIDGMVDFNVELDKISKDIQKRKDNAMAMEFVKVIGGMLVQNGVSLKIEECRDENIEMNMAIEVKYNVRIDGLDFSEHDKPFRDEIVQLKKQIVEYLHDINELFDENKELKQRIAELESKNNQLTESILRKETKIHELESKETEKPTKINLNDRVKIKLTPLGVEIYYHQYDELNKQIKERGGKQLEPRMPEIDKDGYTKFTLWNFMELYGEHIGMCKPNVIAPLYIELCQDEWKMHYNEEPIEKGKE